MKKLILVLGLVFGGCGSQAIPPEMSGDWSIRMSFQSDSGLTGSATFSGDAGEWSANDANNSYAGPVFLGADGRFTFWFGDFGSGFSLNMAGVTGRDLMQLESTDPAISSSMTLTRALRECSNVPPAPSACDGTDSRGVLCALCGAQSGCTIRLDAAIGSTGQATTMQYDCVASCSDCH